MAKKTVRKVPCLVYSRVVGFLTPTQYWNVGKKQEWKDRKAYTTPSVSGLTAKGDARLSAKSEPARPEQRTSHKDSDAPLTFILRDLN